MDQVSFYECKKRSLGCQLTKVNISSVSSRTDVKRTDLVGKSHKNSSEKEQTDNSVSVVFKQRLLETTCSNMSKAHFIAVKET